MIYSVFGKIKKIGSNYIIIQTSCGVGYKIFSDINTINKCKIEKNIDFFCHHISEKGELYGFDSEEALDLFEILIRVSGIGPKIAIKLLSAFSARELISVILSENSDAISNRGSISKKSASKIIIELKGKLENINNFGEINKVVSSNIEIKDILKELGYGKNDIEFAMKNVPDENMDIQKKLKIALKNIAEKNNPRGD